MAEKDYDQLKKKLFNFTDKVAEKTKELAEKTIDAAKETKEELSERTAELQEKARILKDEATDKIKDGSEKLGQYAHDAKVELDRKIYKPVYESDLLDNNYSHPSMVRIAEYDKQLMEKEAFEGAIGYMNVIDKARVLTLFKSTFDKASIKLLPNTSESIYYLSPFSSNSYIELSDYFSHVQKEKVNELNNIAFKLGASYLKITIKEEKESLVAKKSKLSIKENITPVKANGNVEQEYSESQYSTLSIASKMKMNGHNNPTRPELKYFANESDINSLIEMRLDPTNDIKQKTYTLKYNVGSIIKENEAAQIDAILKKFKMKGNASISSKVEKESRMIFEYYIEFPE